MSTVSEYAVDFDVPPFIPSCWGFYEEDQLPSRLRGKLIWSPADCKLWLSKMQQGSKSIKGHQLLLEIRSMNLPVYPVHVLDFLLAHPDQIPDTCKDQYTHFWSPYRSSNGNLFIRSLFLDGGKWIWGWRCLAFCWHYDAPAAVSKS